MRQLAILASLPVDRIKSGSAAAAAAKAATGAGAATFAAAAGGGLASTGSPFSFAKLFATLRTWMTALAITMPSVPRSLNKNYYDAASFLPDIGLRKICFAFCACQQCENQPYECLAGVQWLNRTCAMHGKTIIKSGKFVQPSQESPNLSGGDVSRGACLAE